MTSSITGTERRDYAPGSVPAARVRAVLGEFLRVPGGTHVESDLETRLERALAWATRAQDACEDGALSGGFRLLRGWLERDMEATAAAVPLLARAAAKGEDQELLFRAGRAAAAIRALPVADETDTRVLAISLLGTCEWLEHGDGEDVDALSHAARLVARLEARLRSTRRQSCVGDAALAPTVSAAFCRASTVLGEDRYSGLGAEILDDALRHSSLADSADSLARVTGQRWPHARGVAALPLMLRDVRDTAVQTGRDDLLALVGTEIEKLLRRFELRRRLAIGAPRATGRGAPDRFSPLAWAGAALLWLEESERLRDPRPLNAALFALDGLSHVQRKRPGIEDVDGALPATVVVWHHRRAPFFDSLTAVLLSRALLATTRVIPLFESRHEGASMRGARDVPRSVATSDSAHDAERDAPVPRVVLYAAPDIHRAPRLLEQWRTWGFVPEAVIMEHRPRPPLVRRLRRRLADYGWRDVLEKFSSRMRPAVGGGPEESTLDYCARRGIRVVHVGALDAPETVASVRALAPDLAIHVGTGILRAPLLTIPRLGTLNIHNGVLPRFRGVNVAEWQALLGVPAGCTVHLVDPGVDTGDILLVREVSAEVATSIEELRRRVDRAQGAILGDVLQAIVRSGELPPRRSQRPEEGRQFFRMHPLLRGMLEARLGALVETETAIATR